MPFLVVAAVLLIVLGVLVIGALRIGWYVFLLAPALAMSGYIAFQTVRVMRQQVRRGDPRRQGEAEGGEKGGRRGS